MAQTRFPEILAPLTHSHATVLVVEDDETNSKLLIRLLTAQGYLVEAASSGEAAVAIIERQQPDLVLLDVHLPGIGGFEICRRIKQTAATRLIPVVLVTGDGGREHRIAGIHAGADDFLTKPFDAEELQARVGSLIRLKRYTDELESAESVILSLALTVEARDAYTDGHCQRLARYATALGQALRLKDEEMAALDRGGYLHDVGKIGIPDRLLLKPTALTPSEYALMKQHPVIGDRLCGELRSLRLVRPIVRHHHERLDGSGYPDGLRGDRIPLLAQIVSIADTYDAVTTDRPYRPARPPAIAYDELLMEAATGIRRRDLVDAFIALRLESVPPPAAVVSSDHKIPSMDSV
jgi:putative two-component system response regulator